ncbi:hypothetical protein EC973_001412 [Apophysomyces ossiformis]|uniref:BHLH domain-containing protein n=1 Tax=Apophysomyces ossiformis TaxID=679940 RepID=A0A8H7EPD5_9FUNG|nr:hypothetical protein EC973_001412 [Apophysomyces ossiformis]
MNTNTVESDFGFDEYIMPTTYTGKLECYDQLYPSVSYESLPMPNNTLPVSMVQPFDAYQPSSPESACSRFSPPLATPPLICSSPATHAITEKIAQVNKLPESFLPEFHQYSKETYENGACRKRKQRKQDDDSEQEDDVDGVSAAEMRRQIHIQSEQKRRAQIKDGFDELRQHLPGCVTKKMSKAALLHRTVQHLKHLKSTQASLLSELEKLAKENENLRKFQESVLQKQALQRMYQMGAM